MLSVDKTSEQIASQAPTSSVAYILKGFARTSETFITNEIHLLEKLGLRLSIFSLLRLTGQQQHAVHDEIKAAPEYLPEISSLEDEGLMRWLKHNFAKFKPAHNKLFRERTGAYLATLFEALIYCFRYRQPNSWQPEARFIKEFLQAGYIAARVLDDERVRHLHAHFAHTCTTVTMFASRLSGLPFSFTAHAKDIYLKTLNPGDFLRVKLQRASFVVTCTRANRVYLRGFTDKTPIHVIYHGLDTRQFAYTKHSAEIIGKPLLLSVGRFVEKKGFTYLVEACQLLKQRGYDFDCQIVGGGDEYLKRVQTLIRELHLEDVVRIHPPVTQEELKAILQHATLFALPCQIVESGDRDGIPNVLVEAMATGLPVISTEVSGIPELIKDGADGLLVPERNAEKLANAIERLINDRNLRMKFSQAGRATVCRDFDAERNVQRLYQLFAESMQTRVRA